MLHLIELGSEGKPRHGYSILEVQGFNRDYPLRLGCGLHLSFNLSFDLLDRNGVRDVHLFPGSHLTEAANLDRDPIRVHIPVGYLLIWNPALYHAGGAGSSTVDKWLLA